MTTHVEGPPMRGASSAILPGMSSEGVPPASTPGTRRRAVILVGNPANPYSRAIRLGRTLSAEGYEVEIAATTEHGAPTEQRDGDLVIRRYPPSGPFAGLAATYGKAPPAAAAATATADAGPRLAPAAIPVRGVVPVAAHGPRLVAHARDASSNRPTCTTRAARCRSPRRSPRSAAIARPGDRRRSSSTSSTSRWSRTTCLASRPSSGGCSIDVSGAGPGRPTPTPRSTRSSPRRPEPDGGSPVDRRSCPTTPSRGRRRPARPRPT